MTMSDLMVHEGQPLRPWRFAFSPVTYAALPHSSSATLIFAFVLDLASSPGKRLIHAVLGLLGGREPASATPST